MNEERSNTSNDLNRRQPGGEPVRISPEEIERQLLVARHDQSKNHKSALNRLASHYSDTSQYGKALDCLRQLMVLEPNIEQKAACVLAMGANAEKQQNFVAAVQFYREALAMEPMRNDVWYFIHNNLGYSLNMLGQFAEGEKCCRAAIEINPSRSNGHKNLGIALVGQSNFREAAESFVAATFSNAGDARSIVLLKQLLQQHPELEVDFRKQLAQCEQKVNLAAAAIRRTQTRADDEKNNAKTQCAMGVNYAMGKGVAKNKVEAVKWYRKAAEQNYATAQCLLGCCYEDGQGVTKDAFEAVKWFLKAGEQNYPEAQLALGCCYADGRGVTKDEVEAVKWFWKAAEQNNAAAQCNLGISYTDGRGVAKDEVAAVNWYRKAAEQNLAIAQFKLGICHHKGCGLVKNEVEAVNCYRKAAEQDYAEAQFCLGCCYFSNVGLVKNEVEGYKWLMLATAKGNQSAKQLLTKLNSLMNREEMAEGLRLARNFSASHSINSPSDKAVSDSSPKVGNTGFLTTSDGYLIFKQECC